MNIVDWTSIGTEDVENAHSVFASMPYRLPDVDIDSSCYGGQFYTTFFDGITEHDGIANAALARAANWPTISPKEDVKRQSHFIGRPAHRQRLRLINFSTTTLDPAYMEKVQHPLLVYGNQARAQPHDEFYINNLFAVPLEMDVKYTQHTTFFMSVGILGSHICKLLFAAQQWPYRLELDV